MRRLVPGPWLASIAACGRIAFEPLEERVPADGGAVDAPLATSCEQLAPTCGPTQSSPCCDSPLVDGGTFYRSYDGIRDLDMGFPASVSTFRLDAYEVTVGRFRQFVSAGLGTQMSPPPAGAGGRALEGLPDQAGWDPAWNSSLAPDTAALVASIRCDATFQTWTDAPAGNENRPINCVDWYQAFAFCAWDGGHLPTEAEWNYAASGGAEQRAYPWSSPPSDLTIDATYASYEVDSTVRCMGDGVMGCTLADLVPVGSKPPGKGRYGHSDLGGNVWEWTLDWFQAPYRTPCADCAEVATGTTRVYRGGNFFAIDSELRPGRRGSNFVPSGRNYGIGFRCARAP